MVNLKDILAKDKDKFLSELATIAVVGAGLSGLSAAINLALSSFKVEVHDESVPFVRKGRNVFAKHVIYTSPDVRPKSEVIVVDRLENLLAVGKTVLSGNEMLAFQRGVAVKVRRGIDE